MMNWTCNLEAATPRTLKDKIFTPESSVVDVSAYTAGQKISVECSGDAVASVDGEWATKVITEKEEKIPSYFISKPTFGDASKLQIYIAPYKAGAQNPNILLTSGSEQISLAIPKFEVVSVLDKHDFKMPNPPPPKQGEQQQQGPQPYPYIGAFKLEYPLLLWILLLIVALGLTLAGIRKWAKHYKLKRWLEELQGRQLATTPDKYFYKELRSLHREKLIGIDGYNKLQNAYFTYLEHQFLFPVRDRTINESTKFLLRKTKLSKPSLVHLKRNLLELKKLQASAKNLSSEDLDKMSNTLRKNVDEFHDLLKGNSK